MRKISLFGEDRAHEEFVSAWIERLQNEHQVPVQLRPYSVRGGRALALAELKQFIADVRRGRLVLPDLLVVAIDANCHTYSKRRSDINVQIKDLSIDVVLAVPDHHIERWLLLDSRAFKAALGKGCSDPDKKCDRDRYKRELAQAVRDAGVTPLIRGLEHTRDIVGKMDLAHLCRKGADPSLSQFLSELNAVFEDWSRQ